VIDQSTAVFPAFGSTGVLVVSEPERLHIALEVVQRQVAEVDLACSRFREDSDISRVNTAAGRWVSVSELFIQALEVALGAAGVTHGIVDPTIGRALLRLGYDCDFEMMAPGGLLPAPEPVPGWCQVHINTRTSCVRVPRGVSIDLGATSKALTADRASAMAAQDAGCGVLVSLGGDVAVAGAPPEGGWTIGLADNHAGPAEPGRTIGISSGGVATSSTMVRRWSRGGQIVHHVIDPRTGLPAREVWRTVSVAASTCVGANTASTAALVLGEEAPDWLRSRRLPARLVTPYGDSLLICGWPQEQAA
jgi:FAD:protein FMN transferase